MVMNGGNGLNSYAKNSSYQRSGLDGAKEILSEGIAKSLDLQQIYSCSPLKTFCIADLGCSTGPNTFTAMQNIIDDVTLKCHGHHQIPEFVVFFNDQISNDFKELFASIPPNKPYFASAVAGSFHSRLFAKESLHFVYSAYSLHWLSKIPAEIEDVNSPAWNKGRIYYRGAPKEVVDAYSAQFARDLESFLCARAEELVSGGLMALIVKTEPELPGIELLGTCLMEFATKGVLSLDKVDSFNLPTYFPSLEDFERTTKSNDCFVIERLESLDFAVIASGGVPDVQVVSRIIRAFTEGLISSHFGSAIVDDLFVLHAEKVAEKLAISNTDLSRSSDLFVLLKRK